MFRVRQSSLDAHLPWLDAQWESGCRKGAGLWRRLRDRGFRGSERVVRGDTASPRGDRLRSSTTEGAVGEDDRPAVDHGPRYLEAAGYHGYARMFMVPIEQSFASASDFKAPIRAEIERQGYTIIANVGDQPSDLIGGHAERRFLLPDPFYRVP